MAIAGTTIADAAASDSAKRTTDTPNVPAARNEDPVRGDHAGEAGDEHNDEHDDGGRPGQTIGLSASPRNSSSPKVSNWKSLSTCRWIGIRALTMPSRL